jgi:hypothetical protein
MVLRNLFLGNRSVNMFPQEQIQTQQQFLLETLFSIQSAQSGYKENNWGNLVGSLDVKRTLYVRCSYSETAIITVLKSTARIWLVKAGEGLACSDL